MIDILADTSRYMAATTPRGTDAVANLPYSGFNICPYTNDDSAHVSQCKLSLASELGIDARYIVMPRQTHSSNVAIVDEPTDIKTLQYIDGLVTRTPGLIIGVNTADCVPVLLVDDVEGVIAAVHSGWRGTVARIVSKAIESMQSLGALPHRMHAYIGPCIHQCCFETGPDVAALFPTEFVLEYESANPHVDLPGTIVRQLTDAGISRTNIYEFPVCSRCKPMDYCSARAMGVDSARTFSFIMLKR